MIYRNAFGMGAGGLLTLGSPPHTHNLSTAPRGRTQQPGGCGCTRGGAVLVGWVARGRLCGAGHGGAAMPPVPSCSLELFPKLFGGFKGGGCSLRGCPGTGPSSSSWFCSPPSPILHACPPAGLDTPRSSLRAAQFPFPLHPRISSSLSIQKDPRRHGELRSPAVAGHPRAALPAPVFGVNGGETPQGRVTHLVPLWGWWVQGWEMLGWC